MQPKPSLRFLPVLLTALLAAPALATGLTLDGATATPAPQQGAMALHPETGTPWGPFPDDAPLTMAVAHQRYGHLFETPTVPAGLDAPAAAAWALEHQDAVGRSPDEWIDWAQETFRTEPLAVGGPAGQAPDADAARATLLAAVAAIHDTLGIEITDAEWDAMAAQADALPADGLVAFASLVATVSEAYVAQDALAKEIAPRFATVSDLPDVTGLVTQAERDEMAARAATITTAFQRFRADIDDVVLPASSDPLFSDPEGLIVLGGLGDDTYTRSGSFPDAILIVEPSGNDRYEQSAGGADPLGLLTGDGNLLALSAVLDLLGDDDYVYDGPVSTVQGAGGPGAIGILVDAAGSDLYYAFLHRTVGPFVMTYFDGGAQGYGFGGYGLLLDGLGDDVYQIDIRSENGRGQWAFGQGFGAAGGIGIASDVVGTDQWLSYGLGGTTSSFLGIYTMGVGFWAGLGIMTDTGAGNDIYDTYLWSHNTDYYAQGFGAFGGVGILYEDGGDDSYSAIEEAYGPSPINPLLNCAFGTASLGGQGYMIDVLGNDAYYGDTISTRTAFTMNEGFGGIIGGFGLFVDYEGDDDHVMEAHGQDSSWVAGRGDGLWTHLEPVGIYLDAGGADLYVGPPFSYVGLGSDPNNAVWPALGADLDAMPTV